MSDTSSLISTLPLPNDVDDAEGAVSSIGGPAPASGSAIKLYARASADFEAKLADTVALLKAAAEEHPGQVVQATSLGVEDMILTDLIARHRLPIAIGTLETGMLHAETSALIPTIESHYAAEGLKVEVYHPQAEAVIEFVRTNGDKAMYKSIDLRKGCCGIRKIEPLGRMLAKRTGWITGLRREQSNNRGGMLAREQDDKARAKERIFSHRDSFGQWQPKEQRPELWNLFNTRIKPGEHFRAFPISNWTELDVWLYIARENIPLPNIYYKHARQVIRRKGLLVPLTEVTPALEGETVETVDVRFRTVGDMTCTCPVESEAASPADIVAETLHVTVSERGATRMDDRTSEASMERRKKEGYF